MQFLDKTREIGNEFQILVPICFRGQFYKIKIKMQISWSTQFQDDRSKFARLSVYVRVVFLTEVTPLGFMQKLNCAEKGGSLREKSYDSPPERTLL